MSIITQYRPAFFEGFENAVEKFNSVEELLNIPFVQNFKEAPHFHQYSISVHPGNKQGKCLLMAEYDKGYEWWVVGIIDAFTEELNKLPMWEVKDRKDG